MNLRKLLALSMLLLGLAGLGFSQDTGDKIGFVNLEGVMGLMPEYQAMQKSLRVFEEKLADGLQIKQNYLEQKVSELVEARQNGASEDMLKRKQEELVKLDKEIKESAADADQKLARKRIEQLNPILEKLQGAIEQIAKAKGYTFVLNTVDGTQTSIVLRTEDENDLTRAVLEKLEIDYPKE